MTKFQLMVLRLLSQILFHVTIKQRTAHDVNLLAQAETMVNTGEARGEE